jgi:luciferase-type oxidoreductase
MENNLSHSGFQRMFGENSLTLGFMFPMVRVEKLFPDMHDQLLLARLVDTLGFAALWTRDVPLYDPEFGDVGQIYDPWVWLGAVATHTSRIALTTGAIVLPIRHPLHVAKAAASIDVLTKGRFLLGLASGDRPIEFPAFGVDHATRAERFRENFVFMEQALHQSFPTIHSTVGDMSGTDLIPKPFTHHLPTLVVGTARQSLEWIATHADGWVTYPRDLATQRDRIKLWKDVVAKQSPGKFMPFSQSLFIDLTEDPDTEPTPIFLGYRLGRNRLIAMLQEFAVLGVHHIIFNLRHSVRPAEEVIDELAREVLPLFPSRDNSRATY